MAKNCLQEYQPFLTQRVNDSTVNMKYIVIVCIPTDPNHVLWKHQFWVRKSFPQIMYPSSIDHVGNPDCRYSTPASCGDVDMESGLLRPLPRKNLFNNKRVTLNTHIDQTITDFCLFQSTPKIRPLWEGRWNIKLSMCYPGRLHSTSNAVELQDKHIRHY